MLGMQIREAFFNASLPEKTFVMNNHIADPFTSLLNRIYETEEKIIANNLELMKQVKTLPAESQKEYAEKVYSMVRSTQDSIKKWSR